MATEKEKTIQKLYDDFLNDGGIATPEELYSKIWEAARADAIEECAKESHAIAKHIVDEEIPYIQRRLEKGLAADITGMVTIIDWHLRSLSRKQEEPR